MIQAPNEAGKSTWCAFIRAMLYGIHTGDRDKIGYLSDKTRYRPWDGGAMEGEMELTYGGKSVTLTRTSPNPASPMKKLTAVYTGTSTPVAELEGADAGETLTGMPERVFERTAFIRQAGVRVNGDPELEKRISALVATGDEQLSYSCLLYTSQQQVLFEQEADGVCTGHAGNYAVVCVNDTNLHNLVKTVRITGQKDGKLWGNVIL